MALPALDRLSLKPASRTSEVDDVGWPLRFPDRAVVGVDLLADLSSLQQLMLFGNVSALFVAVKEAARLYISASNWIRINRTKLSSDDGIFFARREWQANFNRLVDNTKDEDTARVLTELREKMRILTVEQAEQYIEYFFTAYPGGDLSIIPCLLSANVIADYGVAQAILTRDPSAMAYMPVSIQKDRVLRIVVYGLNQAKGFGSVDALMRFRDMQPDVLSTWVEKLTSPVLPLSLEEIERLVDDVPPGRAPPDGFDWDGWQRTTMLQHDEVQGEPDIADLVRDNPGLVGEAVSQKGEILPYLGHNYGKKLEFRLMACKTHPESVVWVMEDLLRKTTQGITGIRETFKKVYAAIFEGRLLDSGKTLEEVERDSDENWMGRYERLLNDLWVIYGPESDNVVSLREAQFRARIRFLIKQVMAEFYRPGGKYFHLVLATDYRNTAKEYWNKRQRGEDDGTENASGGRRVTPRTVQAAVRQDILRNFFNVPLASQTP